MSDNYLYRAQNNWISSDGGRARQGHYSCQATPTAWTIRHYCILSDSPADTLVNNIARQSDYKTLPRHKHNSNMSSQPSVST